MSSLDETGSLTMGSCSNSSVQLQKEGIERLRCKLSRLKRAGKLFETGSDWMLLVLRDNGFVFKQLCSAPQGGQRLRCNLSRLKEQANFVSSLDETGSDWMLLVLCDNGFVFKQLCSAPEGGHRTPEMQIEQAEESRRTL